jgi:beta-N-acetylhexosaminidase
MAEVTARDIDARTISAAAAVGGLFMIGFEGVDASNAPLEIVQHLAGAVLFARNIASAEQTRALAGSLRDAAPPGTPLVVAIDQEGGPVSRIATFGTPYPAAMALGAADDTTLTQAVYRTMGDELASLGVTLDFAPVADVNCNPRNPVIGVRSFGEDPGKVGEHVAAAIAGLHAAGVGATAKHFPGHGDTDVDSHRAVPVVRHDGARLRRVELPPFRAAIESGVDAVMSAHVALPAIDESGVPATLSSAALHDLLRNELQFGGVICSDCMEMQAIASNFDPGEAAIASLAAGADLLLYSSSLDVSGRAMQAVADAVRDGRLDRKRIDASLERIAALRRKYGGARISSAGSAQSADARLRQMADAAARAVTVVRDPQGVLPLRSDEARRVFVAQFAGPALAKRAGTGKQSTAFGKTLARVHAKTSEQIRSLDPAGHEYKQLLMAAGSSDVVIAIARSAWRHPLQAQALADLALGGMPLIVIAAREPYDANVAPADAAVIATYWDDDVSLEAAAHVVLGDRAAQGKLPVSLGTDAKTAFEVT